MSFCERLPGDAASIGTPCAITQDTPADECGERDNTVTMRTGDGTIIQNPFPEFDHPCLMAGWADRAALTGDGDQIFVAAVVAPDAGTPILETAALEVATYRLPSFRSQRPHTGVRPLLVSPLHLLEQVLTTAVRGG